MILVKASQLGQSITRHLSQTAPSTRLFFAAVVHGSIIVFLGLCIVGVIMMA